MTVAASKALRVLLLTDENLIPDKPRSKLKGRDAELSKTEYDVLDALNKLGHEVNFAGVGSELSVVRRAILRNKPHVRRPTFFRPARGQLSGAAQAEVYWL
jgi:hypothetical protein